MIEMTMLSILQIFPRARRLPMKPLKWILFSSVISPQRNYLFQMHFKFVPLAVIAMTLEHRDAEEDRTMSEMFLNVDAKTTPHQI